MIIIAATESSAVLPQRTFVASNGSDSNPCSITTPCRGFTTALAHTASGGEIIVLDSAGYGPVTITQPVSIIAPPGVYAGVAVFSGDGITINAPGGNVVLRGLSINGLGGNAGINITSATSVQLDNIIVSNMGAQGVVTSNSGTLVISDSVFRHNAGDGISQQAGSLTLERVRSEGNEGRGLYAPTGATASIDSSSFQQNFGEGIRVEDGGKVSVRASVISGNQSDGIFVNAFNSGAVTIVELDNCMIDANSNNGIEAHASGVALTYVSVTGGHVNYNGSRGIYPTSLTATILLSGVTTFGYFGIDVDYSVGMIHSFGNNSVFSSGGSPPNLSISGLF